MVYTIHVDMWNLFGRTRNNTQKSNQPKPGEVSCVALHELSSGDVRAAVYTVNDLGIQSLLYMGTQAGAVNYRTADYEYIVRHVPDQYYTYGSTHAPLPEEYVIYEDMASKGIYNHTLLRYMPVADNYYSWTALDTDQLVRSHKDKSDQSIGTGLAGLARLFGFNQEEVFVFVSVERYTSAVSLLMGEHVLGQLVVPIGTSTLVRTVADTLSCPTDMALRIVMAHGVMDTHYDHRLRNRIIDTLEPLQQAIHDLAYTYQHQPYKPAFARTPICYWLLGGLGATIPGLASLIGLSLDAEYHDQVAESYKRMLVELPQGPHKTIVPRYYTVLGLAIAGA